MSSLVTVCRSWSQFVNATGRPNVADRRLCRSCAGQLTGTKPAQRVETLGFSGSRKQQSPGIPGL